MKLLTQTVYRIVCNPVLFEAIDSVTEAAPQVLVAAASNTNHEYRKIKIKKTTYPQIDDGWGDSPMTNQLSARVEVLD